MHALIQSTVSVLSFINPIVLGLRVVSKMNISLPIRYAYQPANEEQTKFVVTLNADKYIPSSKAKVSDRKRVDLNGAAQPEKLVKRTVDGVIQKEKERTSSPLRVDITAQKVNKLIIKNDTEDEEELRREVERSTSRKRSRLSPIKFDLADEKRSKLRDDHNTDDDNIGGGEDGQRVMTRRSDVSKKYDNLPPRKFISLHFSKGTQIIFRLFFFSSELNQPY